MKISSNNLNSVYLIFLTIQIGFCFQKLYFTPLIPAQIDCVNKTTIDWLNKATWKLASGIAIKHDLLSEVSF